MTEAQNQRFEDFHWALLSSREPRVVDGLKDFENQIELFRHRKRNEVRRTLEKRAAKVVAFWMRTLGSRPGAPLMQDPSLFRLLGIYKKKSGLSYDQIAKRINNPEMFREGPTLYRVQQAIRRAEKKARGSKALPKP